MLHVQNDEISKSKKTFIKINKKPNFMSLSKRLTKDLDTKTKKEGGIYFTPRPIIKSVLSFIIQYNKNHNLEISMVLEPSFGSGEFIRHIDSRFKNITITGVEMNKLIYDSVKKSSLFKRKRNNINLLNHNFMKYETDSKYDLIIGNPPFFVMSKKDIATEYHQFLEGRPNIFLLFILKSLNLLIPNGILAFVLPKSSMNCLYYRKVRSHIYDNYTILRVRDYPKATFLETQQEVCVVWIQNRKPEIDSNMKYVYKLNGNIIFNSNTKKLGKLLKKSINLDTFGFNVHVGKVVWNQVKDKLTEDSSKTRLIYSSDIVNNTIGIKTYKNKEKKNYIDKIGLTDPLLVVNRGYGKGKYKFSYALVDTDKPYQIENHLICISQKDTLDKKKLLEKYKIIMNSFERPQTEKFVHYYFGNNSINTEELQYILPIYGVLDI